MGETAPPPPAWPPQEVMQSDSWVLGGGRGRETLGLVRHLKELRIRALGEGALEEGCFPGGAPAKLKSQRNRRRMAPGAALCPGGPGPQGGRDGAWPQGPGTDTGEVATWPPVSPGSERPGIGAGARGSSQRRCWQGGPPLSHLTPWGSNPWASKGSPSANGPSRRVPPGAWSLRGPITWEPGCFRKTPVSPRRDRKEAQ